MAEGERMRWTLSRWRECVRFLSSRHQDAVVPTVERGWRESGLVCLCTHPPTGRSRWSWSLLPCLPPVKWQKSVTGETIQATHFISLIRSVHERVAHQYRLNVWLKFYKAHRKKNQYRHKIDWPIFSFTTAEQQSHKQTPQFDWYTGTCLFGGGEIWATSLSATLYSVKTEAVVVVPSYPQNLYNLS